ncbi:alkaline phosphatase [Bacillus sp. TS-2]|nr:alkaline phosphatase [Bacillus sp. TS-2]
MKLLQWLGVCVVSISIFVVGFILYDQPEAVQTAGAEKTADNDLSENQAKNVILMIPDGFSTGYATNYRIFKGEETIFDSMLVGMMKTHSSDNWVTDSAAAGTAMATGVKTNNGMISVTPDGEMVSSILDAASKENKATGLVATSTITHATPAVFASNVESRGSEAEIALQMVERVDLLFGGGRNNFLPENEGGNQPDRNLITEAQDKGFDYVENKDELMSLENQNEKVLGLFAPDAMSTELERHLTDEPSLAEMTDSAMTLLNSNENGFFLMVEGSQIDWAGHAHDAVWAMTDTAAFEEAVEVALDFAKEDGETLVIVVGDHETGGMTVGGYDEYLSKVEILHQVKATGNYIASQMNEERSNAQEVVQELAGFELTEEERLILEEAAEEELSIAVNKIISERAYVGWSTNAHTGVDLPLYAYGPGTDLFSGLLDNTDLPKKIADAMDIDFK